MKKIGKKARGSQTGRPIMVLLDILGQRWVLRILWELREQRLSFRQLRDKCDNVSPTSLNLRLKQLRQAELIDLDENGYGYTRRGRQLGGHLLKMNKWADEWASDN
jgi:DNA-binding HxlR family transcriptional regulator